MEEPAPNAATPRQISVADAVELAQRMHRQGQLEAAEQLYRQILQQLPDQADALHFLGLLLFQRREHAQGIEKVRRAVALLPDYGDAHANLANMLLDRGELDTAEQHLQTAVALMPEALPPRLSLAVLRRAQNRLDEAAELLAALVLEHEDNALVHNAFGNVRVAQGRFDEAMAEYFKAIALDETFAPARWCVGYAMVKLGRLDEARKFYRDWTAEEPENPTPRHLLAACGGAEVPARADDAYVRTTFDIFAASFDAKLESLEYRAPQLIARLLAEVCGAASRSLDLLDAGCGTGLLGLHVGPWCRSLRGVDLSPGMLANARARGIYDSLDEQELTAFIGRHEAAFDVVASADTLCYFGALEEFMKVAHRALRTGGRLLFSVESAAATQSYQLQHHGRYAHERGYVERVLREAGFVDVRMIEESLRVEAGEPVPGLIVAARRGGDAQMTMPRPSENTDEGWPAQPAVSDTVPSAETAQQMSISDALGLAQHLHRLGQLEGAENIYRRILQAVPDQADALHLLGLLQYQRREHRSGIDSVRRALEIFPDHADAHANLGNMLLEQGELEDAGAHLQRAMELAPNALPPRQSLALLRKAQGRLDEAETLLAEALKNHPDNALLHNEMGNVMAALDRPEEALVHYWKTRRVDSDFPGARVSIGRALSKLGRWDDAQHHYREWIQAEPDNPTPVHMLATCGGAQVPGRAADAYVSRLFDWYAASFDSALARLEYRAPQLVAELMERELGPPRGNFNVLDAGCGTGLAAPLIRPWCRRLIGVDLSQGMLQRAQNLRLYDALHRSELTAFMKSCPSAFDVIVSADTLCYFGDLDEVMGAAHAALRPGGWLLFTLEHSEAEPSGYVLQHSGRYAHGRRYVQQVLAQAQLQPHVLSTATLRLENGAPVEGLIVAVRKPA